MDELIQRIATAAGLDLATAREALKIILNFIATEAPAAPVDRVLDALPGSRELVDEAGGGGSPGLLGGLLGGMGAMGVFSALTSAGLSFGQVQTVAREIMSDLESKVGEDTIGEISAAIPGLDQVL